MSDILRLRRAGTANPVNAKLSQYGEAYGMPDPNDPNVLQEVSFSLSTAGGPGPNQAQKTFTSEVTNPSAADIVLYTVSAGKTFLLTDLIVTGTPASAVLTRLKARSTITSGAISIGSASVTVANPDTTPSWAPANSAPYGDLFFVGQTVYVEDPSSAQYEAVAVTAVQRTNGIVNGFTAAFAKTHTANAIIAVPLSIGHVNSTKGIELVGIETQPHAPGGWTIAMGFGAQTATFAYNVAGIEQ